MHAMQIVYIWTYNCKVPEPFIVPLKADLQALACLSKYHDNEYLLMQTKDVRSDDIALGKTSSQECTRPTKVGSRNRQSFPLLIMTNDNGNIIAMLCEVPTTHLTYTEICCRVKNLPLTPVKTSHKDGLYPGIFRAFYLMSFFSTSLLEKNLKRSCLDTISILFIHGRVMLAMEGKSVLPMHISPFGIKEEVLLKLPKQGLDKICIGMDIL